MGTEISLMDQSCSFRSLKSQLLDKS